MRLPKPRRNPPGNSLSARKSVCGAHFPTSALPPLTGPVMYSVPIRRCRSGCVLGAAMKVRSSVRRICEKCKLIRRKGVVRIICEDPRHKQRQG